MMYEITMYVLNLMSMTGCVLESTLPSGKYTSRKNYTEMVFKNPVTL